MNIVWHQSHNASVTAGTRAFISLEWNYSESDMHLLSTFIVEIRSMGKVPLYYTTPNTTLQLSVVYNQEYGVSLLAHNCMGNSTSSNLTLLISKQKCYYVRLLIISNT